MAEEIARQTKQVKFCREISWYLEQQANRALAAIVGCRRNTALGFEEEVGGGGQGIAVPINTFIFLNTLSLTHTHANKNANRIRCFANVPYLSVLFLTKAQTLKKYIINTKCLNNSKKKCSRDLRRSFPKIISHFFIMLLTTWNKYQYWTSFIFLTTN